MHKFLIVASLCLLAACGSGGGSQSKPSTPVNTGASSSNSGINIGDMAFVYPSQKAHLGGANSTELVVRIQQTEQSPVLSQLQIGDVMLMSEGSLWRSVAPLNLANSNNQMFPITAQIAETGEWVTLGDLILNNGPINNASNDRVYTVTGLAVDDDGAIYLSNPYDARVYSYNMQTADIDIIYQGTATDLTQVVYWPIAVDSPSDTVYVSTDSYIEDTFSANLVVITPNQTNIIVDQQNRLTSTRGLFLDLNSQLPMSALDAVSPIPSVYTLDYESQTPLQRWFLAADANRVNAPSLFPANSESALSPLLNILSLTGKLAEENSTLLIAREFETPEARGDATLLEITSTATEFDAQGTSTQITKLEGITKPSALAYNREGTHVFIADNDRVWLLNMQDYSKELVTSSSFISPKGEGSKIGNNVTAMAIHPELNYLYLAAGTNGLLMVDLESGNRITVVK